MNPNSRQHLCVPPAAADYGQHELRIFAANGDSAEKRQKFNKNFTTNAGKKKESRKREEKEQMEAHTH